MTPKLPTIVDNRNANTVLAVLKSILPGTRELDIAAGVFDLGSLRFWTYERAPGDWVLLSELRGT